MILKVKKPDFLGNSMWEFNHEGHPMTASILDIEWLAEFRKDGLGGRPGVALRALVRIDPSFDDDNEALPPRAPQSLRGDPAEACDRTAIFADALARSTLTFR